MISPIKGLLIGAPLAFIAYYLIAFAIQVVRYRFFHPLSKFPGPFWGSVTRLWLAYHCCVKEDEHLILLEAHKKYGPVIRASPTLLLVSDATKLPDIYHRYANKTKFYIQGSTGEHESVLSTLEHKQHAALRKLIAGPYSFTNIKKMEPLIDARMTDWIERLKTSFARTGKNFDFAPWAHYVAYDVISELAFGAAIGFIKQGEDVAGLVQANHVGLPVFGFMSRLYPFTTWIKDTWFGKKYLVASAEQDNGFGVMLRFRDKLLAERLEKNGAGTPIGRTDFMQSFIDAKTSDGEPLTTERIGAELMLILVAGSDTTASVLQALMCMLLTHPEAFARVATEIDEASKSGQLSEMPQFDEVTRCCPYYVACVKETTRLWPPAANWFPRSVNKGGIDLDGTFVPEGTEIAATVWVVHRDENIYGLDALEWRPERWLADPELAKKYEKYSFAFGYGARTCLGRDVALMELYKGPLQLLRKFKVEPVNQQRPGMECYKGGLHFWKDIWLRIEERQPGK